MASNYQLLQHLRSMEDAGRPERVAKRALYNQAKDQAMAEVRERFPTITPENFEAADEYRWDRINHWKEALK